MSAEITGTENIKEAAKRMRKVSREILDFKPAFRQMLPFMQEGLEDNIKSQGSTIAENWPPLSKKTLERKSRQGSNKAALILSGELLRTIKSQKGIRYLDKKGVCIAPPTEMKYPYMLNYGAAPYKGRRGQNLGYPARPWIGWNKRALAAADRIIETYSAGQMKKVENFMHGLGVE